MKKNIFLLSLTLLLCVSVQAKVYKWVDADGKVHFGDRAPENKKSETIDEHLNQVNIDHGSSAAPARTAATTEKTQDEKNLEAQKKRELEKAIGPRCKKWKSDIAAIARGDRGRFIGEDGKEEVVLEKDRGKKLEEWRSDYLQSNCQSLYPLDN